MARRQRVLIEFTKDTKDDEGAVVRTAGDKLYVDPMSARSFVDELKVAKRLTEKQAEKVEAAPTPPALGPVGGAS